MSYVVGIAWFKDEATYRRARDVFTDSGNLPASYEDWKSLVERQVELIKGAGNIALRVDMDPEHMPPGVNPGDQSPTPKAKETS